MSFDTEVSWVGRTAVVAVRGDLDALTAPQFTEKILDVTAEQPSAVIIDLSSLDFLASAGITALISANEYITAKINAAFAVVADGPTTSRPLKLMAIDTVIDLHPKLQGALDTYGTN